MIEKVAEILKEIAEVAEENDLPEPYLVGGAVRDMLLDKTPSDFDITCGGPEALILADKFAMKKRVPIYMYRSGAKRVRYRGMDFDFSPHAVFSDHTNSFIAECMSRDYTINSIMIRCSDGEFVDLFGGVDDLENKVLRCTYSPEVTFSGPANALRGLKFIGSGFEPTEETEKGICENLHKIKDLPYGQSSRVTNNVFKRYPQMIQWLAERDLLKHMPETKYLILQLAKNKLLGEI